MKVVTAEEVGLSGTRLNKINLLTQRYIDEGKLAGTITLVARRGKVAHLQCQGKMDLEADKDMTEDTLFRIYSMTKPITSTALMMLYEEGKFQLDDPVSKFIPQFKKLQVYGKSGHTAVEREMTITDLLTHTSGLTYGFMKSTAVDAMYREQQVEQSDNLEQMIDKLGQIPLLFTPGSRWSYSIATDVCGYLVQKISDTPFNDYLHEKIFRPLEMIDTHFRVPKDKQPRLSACYARTDDDGMRLVDAPETSFFLKQTKLYSGGGGLVSTLADYYQFTRMLLNKGKFDGGQMLGRKTVELMASNHLPDNGDLSSMGQAVFSETPYDGIGFGLGFSVMLDPAKAKILGSAGEYSWGGMASTNFFIDPEEQLIVIMLTQLLPSSSYPIRRELRVTTYQSIID